MKVWIMTAFNQNPSDDHWVFAPTKAAAMDAARRCAGGSFPSCDPDFSYSIAPVEIGAGRDGICQVLNSYAGAR